ncbi:hypothetical protein AFLA_000528 [Aspergillus flavus NRRL3357]|nr:hypothetical protein AFLA_000528 [Aspergillus flavus NRRL3357]
MDGNVVLLLVFLSRRLVYSVRESNQRGLTGTLASGALLVKGGETTNSWFRTVILQGELGRYAPVLRSSGRSLAWVFDIVNIY